MAKLRPSTSHGIGSKKANETVFSGNHYASDQQLTPDVKKKIASLALNRVAGNIYECPSTKDFWKVQGNKIVKLVVDVVDNGETLKSAPADNPMDFLNDVLDDLSF